jgi:hypothetical protein
MLGAPLLAADGYPLRDIVPGIFGMKIKPALLNPLKLP